MAFYPPITEADAKRAVAVLKQCGGNQTQAADMLGLSRGGLQNRLRAAEKFQNAKVASGAEPRDAESTAADRVYELEAQLKAVKSQTLTDEWVKRKIIGLSDAMQTAKSPQWLVQKDISGKHVPGVPVALWSDWHWGEQVFPAQINGVNEYNLEIAHRRARKLVETTIMLLRKDVVNPHYPGIVINLGGDMMSGDIHDELSESNEMPVMPCLLDLYGVLRWAISTMADEFGHVFVPCVAGNHGRNTHKPRAKDRAFSNFDWLLYQFLARSFEGDKRIQFFIPDGSDALYTVAGHRFLLTHGDQFRGGDGMIGHFGPVLRGHKKKLSRNANIGLEFDTMLHGHFHTYFPTSSIIGNGSLKGLDEYASQGNFGYEPPIQALMMVHPDHGITKHMPINLEPHFSKVARKPSDWVTWHNDRKREAA